MQDDAHWMPPRPIEIAVRVSGHVAILHQPFFPYIPAFGLPRDRRPRKGEAVQFTLADDKEVIVSLTRTPDEEGNVDPTVPVWSSNNPDMVTVTPVESDPSGLSALISGPFPQRTGQAQITAQGAPGTAPFVVDVTVVPDLAETGFGASFGPATRRSNIPAPEPPPEPEPAPEPPPAP